MRGATERCEGVEGVSENVVLSRNMIENHPFEPFLPEGAKVLFLGSFPPRNRDD